MADPENRSGSYYSAPRDSNRVPTLLGVSSTDGVTPTPLEVNSSGQLLTTSSGGGGGGGTQYASGTTTPGTVTGNALIFDNSGTLEDVSVANPLPVAATFSGTLTSSPTFAQNPGAGTPTPAYGLIDSSYRPQVSVATALPAGTNAIGSITNTAFIANAGTNLNTSLLALESGGNLAAIKADTDKIPSQGQALAAASLPVVLTAAQITTLTPPAAITNYAEETGGNLATIATNTSTIITDLTGGTQKSQITDGTNIGNVLKSDGSAAGQNAQIVSGTGYTTSTISLSAGSQNTSWYDMLNYSWVSVEILTNTTPATLTFMTSGDASETNSSNTALMQSSNTGNTQGPAVSTTSATATFHGPRTGRYFRITSNLAGGNTATLVLTFFTNASALPSPSSVGVSANSVPGGITYIGGANASGNLNGFITGTKGDAQSQTMGVSPFVYNGTTADMARSATTASGTTGLGIPAAGILGFDGTNYQRVATSTAGTQYVLQRADTSTLTNVSASATSVVVLASNTARKSASIYNDSTAICYIKFGTTASTTSFTVPLAAATYYELPGGYTGEIDGIWVTATGTARVTELT